MSEVFQKLIFYLFCGSLFWTLFGVILNLWVPAERNKHNIVCSKLSITILITFFSKVPNKAYFDRYLKKLNVGLVIINKYYQQCLFKTTNFLKSVLLISLRSLNHTQNSTSYQVLNKFKFKHEKTAKPTKTKQLTGIAIMILPSIKISKNILYVSEHILYMCESLYTIYLYLTITL